jgi:tRNA pseudouridine55 synthase
MAELGYFLNIAKPTGVTSRDVVDGIGRLARTKRVGHAGTLDPLASGVLVLALGRATRLIEYVQRQSKSYLAEFLLGVTSPSDDLETEPIPSPPHDPPSVDAIRRSLDAMTGSIEQRPPAFSALKIAGQPAYAKARRGHAVDLKPRPVHIERIDLISFDFPRVQLRIRCGSGTYVRSMARDLGETLGCGGLMSRLERTAVGPFTLEAAIDPKTLSHDNVHSFAMPLRSALVDWASATLEADDAVRFEQGQIILIESAVPAGECAVYRTTGELLGLAESFSQPGRLKPMKGGFSTPDQSPPNL